MLFSYESPIFNAIITYIIIIALILYTKPKIIFKDNKKIKLNLCFQIVCIFISIILYMIFYFLSILSLQKNIKS